MFYLLTKKFEDLFYKIRNKGKLNSGDLDGALREIKLALLEADVNFKVAGPSGNKGDFTTVG